MERKKIIAKFENKSITQNDMNDIRVLLNLFGFDIPEEQLPYIKIESISDLKLVFFNNLTGEKCTGLYTDYCPRYDLNPPSSECERYFAQIIESKSTVRTNWFYVEENSFEIVPQFKRKKFSLFEGSLFSIKTSNGEYVLHIQKDFPESYKNSNLLLSIYAGIFKMCSQILKENILLILI